MAFREGMKKAGVQLLEPIMKVRATDCQSIAFGWFWAYVCWFARGCAAAEPIMKVCGLHCGPLVLPLLARLQLHLVGSNCVRTWQIARNAVRTMPARSPPS